MQILFTMAPAKNGKNGKAGKHTTPVGKPGKRGNQFDSLNHRLTQTLQRLADAIEQQNALLLARFTPVMEAQAADVPQSRRVRLKFTPSVPSGRRLRLKYTPAPRTPPRVPKPVDETICHAPVRRLRSAPSPTRPVGRNLMALFQTANLAPVTTNPFAAGKRAEGRYPSHPVLDDEDEDD